MGFKKSGRPFEANHKFQSEMVRFVSEEAGQFTAGENEAAAAAIDDGAEGFLRLSAEKDVTKVKAAKAQLKEWKKKERSDVSGKKESHPSIHQSETKELFVRNQPGKELTGGKTEARTLKGPAKDPKSGQGSFEKAADSRFLNDTKTKDLEAGRERTKGKAEVKKEQKRAQKKAARKKSVARMLKAKKDMSNDFSGIKESSGNAFTDANRGLLHTLSITINPMTYAKKLMAQLAALVAPYILMFMTMSIIVVVFVSLLFQVLMPLKNVGDAITGFLSIVSVDTDTFTNAPLSGTEIDAIVADSRCDATQEKVLRFALSKVGFPYSQDLRSSGRAYDCSSLAYYAWKEAGVDLSGGSGYPPTAASGASSLNGAGKAVASNGASAFSMQPGDLVYYGGSNNGRYLGIYHVAIYIGNGKAVEALNTKYGVVMQTLRTKNAIMVVRPNK